MVQPVDMVCMVVELLVVLLLKISAPVVVEVHKLLVVLVVIINTPPR